MRQTLLKRILQIPALARWGIAIGVIIILAFLFFPQLIVSAQERSYIIPNLNTEIPGLKLEKNPVTTAYASISVPFLGAYISAIYKYALSLGLVAAAVMLVYGGFLYLLSPYGYSIQKAKQKIVDALVGLIILLGSYVILVNINPRLTVFGSLAMEEVVSLEEHMRIAMQDKPGPTSPSAGTQDGDIKFTTEEQPEVDPIKPPEGKCKAIVTVNKLAYYQYVMDKLQGKTFEVRVVQAAEILADCKVSLGHCGNTVATAWAMAGVGPKKDILEPNSKKRKVFWMGSSANPPGFKQINVEKTWGAWCGQYSDCNSKLKAAKEKGMRAPYIQKLEGAVERNVNRTCHDSPNNAVAEAMEEFKAKSPGYPNNFADELRPGDWVNTYTANSECDGGHSSMFLGWDESKSTGLAWIFDGAVKQRVQIKKRCLTEACKGKKIPGGKPGYFYRMEAVFNINRARQVWLRDGIYLAYCKGKPAPNNLSICGTKGKPKSI